MHFDLPHLGQRDHHPPANVIDMLQLIAIEEHPDVSGIVAAPDRSGNLRVMSGSGMRSGRWADVTVTHRVSGSHST